MSFSIIKGDITDMKVDAIVNAANTELLQGSGVCHAIFDKAGKYLLKEACIPLSPIHTGSSVITPGFRLPAKYIIHTAGPIYSEHTQEDSKRYLSNAYLSALKLATAHKLKTIAFPLISSGVYGYPPQEALEVALDTIAGYLKHHSLDVTLVIYDRTSFKVHQTLLQSINDYIEANYEHESIQISESVLSAPKMRYASRPDFRDLDEPFSTTLLRLIDHKGRRDSEVYKRANIDKRLFSKIRSNLDYTPSKQTALAFCIALELDLDETHDLLERAGYTLSKSKRFDVIIEYFIKNQIYDIYTINTVLFEHDEKQLGG